MNWFALALGCAFFTATTATLSKYLLREDNVFFIGWIRFACALPILALFAFFIRPSFAFEAEVWKTIAIMLPLELAAYLAYLRALQLSPLSLTFPFLGFTPAFSVIVTFFLLKEKPALLALGGIFLVSVGAYLLNAGSLKNGARAPIRVLAPIRQIYKEKGSMLMVMVAFLFGITSAFGKRAAMLSSPVSFSIVYYSIFFILLTMLLFARKELPAAATIRRQIPIFLVMGATFALAIFFHYYAILLTNVSYMISVKRLSLVISVVYGAIVFREREIGYRLLGSFVMLAGILLIALGQ